MENTSLLLKAVKETSLNEYIQKLKHVAIVRYVPSKFNLEIWKNSTLKTRMLYLCLLGLYLVPLIDNFRIAWFIVEHLLSNDGGDALAKFLVMFIKLFSTTTALIIIWKRDDINHLLQEYEDYVPLHQDERFMEKYYKFGMRYLKSNVCLNFLSCFVFQLIFPVVFQDPLYLLDILTFPVLRDSNLYLLMLIISFLSSIFSLFIYLPYIAIEGIFESFFIDEYNYLSEIFRNFIHQQGNRKHMLEEHANRSEGLIELINQHAKLCRLLNIANKVFQFLTAVILFLHMINLCAIAYELSNNLVTAKSYTFQIAPAAMSATFCVCRLYSGIKINDSAHQLVDHIYAMPLHDLSHEAIIKLSFFLHRLTSEQIGISIGGCFVINPASVLTLIGSIITYSIVAYQTRS
ncbi:uncharacterized protein LOC118764605 isoform X2 [Octopus sinensis]|uniref:Uncharacterized protein LOC118764605 isoform X2 n=1 Tax=Octopus sinensis TaxID=2607531 RepID=A0A7E6F2A1_9MOLL|nr:uncharacterized protein LOC118764605 isoform X2 [Octopus sinensis]